MAPLPESLDVTSIVLKHYVDDGPVPLDTFGVVHSKLTPSNLGDGKVLGEVLYLSVDPYMRPLMRLNKSHYASSFTPGQPLAGRGMVLIRESKVKGFAPGDIIRTNVPWSNFVELSPNEHDPWYKVPQDLLGKVPLSYFLGTLGMPGLTAYSSIKRIAEPKKGDTAYVSAAAGAVGQVVGQVLKNVYGCRVVGSAGGEDKVKLLESLGFDAAWDHRTTDIHKALSDYCPKGIDIYFDNVGGETLEAAIEAANVGARIVACGMISQYDLAPEDRYGVKNLFHVVAKQIKMQGFIVTTLSKGMEGDFAQDMGQWVHDGKVKVVEHVTDGLENIGAAFTELFKGANVGKAVVKVSAADPHPVATKH